LASAVKRLPTLPIDIWCKLHYFEKGRMTAKYYSMEWNLLVDGSPVEYDGYV